MDLKGVLPAAEKSRFRKSPGGGMFKADNRSAWRGNLSRCCRFLREQRKSRRGGMPFINTLGGFSVWKE